MPDTSALEKTNLDKDAFNNMPLSEEADIQVFILLCSYEYVRYCYNNCPLLIQCPFTALHKKLILMLLHLWYHCGQ